MNLGLASFKRLLSLSFYFPLFLTCVFCKVVNITVDDQNDDSATGALPIFLPSNLWNDIGQSCPLCVLHPDPNRTFDGTWHDATTHGVGDPPRTITYTFTGKCEHFKKLYQ